MPACIKHCETSSAHLMNLSVIVWYEQAAFRLVGETTNDLYESMVKMEVW